MSATSSIDARLAGLARDLNRLALTMGVQALETPLDAAIPMAIDLRALSVNLSRLADTIDALSQEDPLSPASLSCDGATAAPGTPLTIEGWLTGA